MSSKYEIEIGGKKIEFQIRDLAQRANGEVMIRCGDTQVLATCVMSSQEIKGLGYFPLSVNYEERYYATGKILGSRYIKREGKPSDNAVVISRIIDRTIRPLFDKDLKKEVQVIVTCLSWDEKNDPDILGILGASLSLLISDIPWQGPLGVIRVGEKDGKLILNPTYQEREEGSLDIMFSGTRRGEKTLFNMIEAAAIEVEEDLILEAAKKALSAIEDLIEFQKKIGSEIRKQKILLEKEEYPELTKQIKEFLGDKIEKILFPSPFSRVEEGVKGEEKGEGEKTSIEEGMKQAEQLNGLKSEFIEMIEKERPEKSAWAKEFFEEEVRKVMQEKILKEGRRVDGRKLDEIREVNCEVGLVPRAHGSSLFSRGLTKSLSILTLGGPGEHQLIEGMEVVMKKRFLHHYNFPPYSTGEVAVLRGPSRREIGHGMLVEKALLPVIPDFDDFPYTIRIVSEIVCSNGSTSMAAACSSSLALMDAGVPIKRPVAGISLGLIQSAPIDSKHLTGSENGYKLLTDIQGPEDFYGDMDFKIAGTIEGITAIQMDVKTTGIGQEILKEALVRGKMVRLEILDLMEKILSKPRTKLSPWAPKIYTLEIPIEKIGEVIGPKGHTIKRISEETGATIDIEPTGIIYVTSTDEESGKKAIGTIKNITRVIKTGEAFWGLVTRKVNFGTFLELIPGQEGLLHNSQIRRQPQIGDKVWVKVASVDEQGRINLELKTPSGPSGQYDTKSKAPPRKYGSTRKH